MKETLTRGWQNISCVPCFYWVVALPAGRGARLTSMIHIVDISLLFSRIHNASRREFYQTIGYCAVPASAALTRGRPVGIQARRFFHSF